MSALTNAVLLNGVPFELDIALTHRLASRSGILNDITIQELVLVSTDDIIESHYYPEYARPYILVNHPIKNWKLNPITYLRMLQC
jgi:hypothetical protein